MTHAEAYLRLVSITYLTFAFTFSFQGIIKGAGDTIYQLLFTIISSISIRVPLGYIMVEVMAFKETGIWVAILISVFVSLILYYSYYASGKWKVKVIRNPELLIAVNS